MLTGHPRDIEAPRDKHQQEVVTIPGMAAETREKMMFSELGEA